MKTIKVEATPQPAAWCKRTCYLPRNDAAALLFYLTRGDYLDEKDLYVLRKLGLEVEICKKNTGE